MKNAIPTFSLGRQFRSRLEARWANVFELLGWPWQYEPIDLDGYIPDFIINFKHAPILVEVKPIYCISEAETHIENAQLAGWEKEILVVGANIGPSFAPDAPLTEVMGALWQTKTDNGTEGVLFHCLACKKWSLFNFTHSFHCRSCGCGDGAHHICTEEGTLEALWLRAGNEVQWKGPGK